MDVHHGAEWDVTQIGRCAMIANNAIRQHGEWMRIIAEKHAGSLHTDAATTIRVIDEDEFTTVGVGFHMMPS